MVPRRRLGAGVFTISLAVAAAVFAFDVALPLGIAAGVPYVALVLVGLWARRPGYCLWMAVAGTLLTALGLAVSEPAGIPWMVWTNRLLAGFAIWVTAILV